MFTFTNNLKRMFREHGKNEVGFTIIELLIVVAIIAILTGIVLFNVSAWINQSKDSSIKGDMSSILTNSAKFIDNNGTYTGFCTDASYTGPSASVTALGTTQSCNTTDTAFCGCSTLKTNPANVFCVDSIGSKKSVNGTDCATECDATAVCL